MCTVIAGSAHHVPDRVITNEALSRVMDTSDEWIRRRTGVVERRVVEPGTGASDLGAAAGRAALQDAGVRPDEVDALVTATMTPDMLAPGIAGLVQDKIGLGRVAAFDLRQQCAGFLYGLELADAFIAAGKAEVVLVVGAEVHAGFQPWGPRSWELLGDASGGPLPETEREANTAARGWSVLFGDGAGAMVLRRGEPEGAGFLGFELATDGGLFRLIHVPGVGFASRPFVDEAMLQARLHWPAMDGRELFRRAVRLMPEAVRRVTASAGLDVGDLDLVIAHQANLRIVAGVAAGLGLDGTQVPSNIERYGNTTSGTLPILYDELARDGRIEPGALIAFTAFGAGAHWGAALYRVPG